MTQTQIMMKTSEDFADADNFLQQRVDVQDFLAATETLEKKPVASRPVWNASWRFLVTRFS